MNGVIYARYSSDNQREESIEGQLRECKEYASRNGIRIISTYIDRAFSAKTDNRPQFRQMIKDSDAKTFDAVLVWKLDRFSRNRYDSAHYKRILKNNRVQVISVTEPISNSPEGIMLESLLEGMAEYYSAELSEKVSRGHKENALKAKFNGGVIPLGYRIDEQRHYQIDPATAPIVQEVFGRYADGETVKELCEDLNARGIRTGAGRLFTKSSFQNLLKNRRYLGEYRYKDVVIEGAIPAIIDPITFEKVQMHAESNRRAPSHFKNGAKFILTTKVFCGKCGAMVVGDSGTSKTGDIHYYYKCGNHKRAGKRHCNLKAIRKEVLEKVVAQTAVQYVLQDNVVNEIVDLVDCYQMQENTRLPVLREELHGVDRKINNLLRALENGIVTETTKQRLDELELQRNTLQHSIDQEQVSVSILAKDEIKEWLLGFKRKDLNDLKIQKYVIDSFVNSVYIFDDSLVVNFNCTDGQRRITLSDVKGSVTGRNGSPNKKRLLCKGAGAFLHAKTG